MLDDVDEYYTDYMPNTACNHIHILFLFQLDYISLSVYGVPSNTLRYAQAYTKDLEIFLDKPLLVTQYFHISFPKYEFIMNLDCEFYC